MAAIRHILVATDFSRDGDRAVAVAGELATSLRAKLTILHVVQLPSYAFLGGGVYVPSPELSADIMSEARGWLAAAKERISGIEVVTLCCEGDPAAVILRWANENEPDLIVLGSHGRHGLRRLLLGSVAAEVLRGARCPVTTVRSDEEARASTSARAMR